MNLSRKRLIVTHTDEAPAQWGIVGIGIEAIDGCLESSVWIDLAADGVDHDFQIGLIDDSAGDLDGGGVHIEHRAFAQQNGDRLILCCAGENSWPTWRASPLISATSS